LTLFLLFVIGLTSAFAQGRGNYEKYGRTLNLGLGIGGYAGYYGYVGTLVPVIHANYEFDVAPSFTLAPFITFYSHRHNDYRETVVPIGVKGSYYFDRIFMAGPKWDFYLGASLGFALRSTQWNSGFTGNRDNYKMGRPLFLDLHLGAEYHITNKLGIFLDLTSGVSTIGLAFH
jgi:hypothetical protein